jgi:hypothetical protein
MLIIRPKMKHVAENKKTLATVNEDIEKQRKHSKMLLTLTQDKEDLEAAVAQSEAGLFGGITVGDLSRVVNTIVKTRYPQLKVNYLGDQAEILPGKRYSELSNEFTVAGASYHNVLGFIGALETANPGLRVTNVDIATGTSRSEKPGSVTAGIQVKLVGMFEGNGIPQEWSPESDTPYDSSGLRNPFGLPGSELVIDPEQAFKEKAFNIRVTMNTGDSLWIKDISKENSGARECLLRKLMPVFEPQKVRLYKIAEDYFIVVREDDKKVFKLVMRQNIGDTTAGDEYERGDIKAVIELKP